jgi:hypothetical protein
MEPPENCTDIVLFQRCPDLDGINFLENKEVPYRPKLREETT